MKRPFVFINMAMTADGKIASTNRKITHLAVGPTTNACWNYVPRRMLSSPVPARSTPNPTSRWVPRLSKNPRRCGSSSAAVGR